MHEYICKWLQNAARAYFMYYDNSREQSIKILFKNVDVYYTFLKQVLI